MTISDTRTLDDDKSGQVLCDLITGSGHELTGRAIVKDDVRQIRSKVRKWTHRGDIDVIITTGGTGLTGRDVTPEAMRGLFDKEIEGFATTFHMISWPKIGTSHHAVASGCRRHQEQVRVLPARLARRLPRRLERVAGQAARPAPSPVQFRRDHAKN